MIEVKNLTKKFGKITAVDNISFTVNKGEIVGFLGPNGAGKSTSMNIMTGFISATEGTVTIDGYDILEEPEKAKKQIGYLPENPPVYSDMTVTEYLEFVCDLKGVKKSERQEMIGDILRTVRLSEVRKRIIKNLSKGYRQRVGLAQAIVGYPGLLILDEPTVGLDPGQVLEMREVIRNLGEKHTVILSSHILQEVNAVCDRIIIINKGRIVADSPAERLSDGIVGNRVYIEAKTDKESLEELLTSLPDVKSFTADEKGDISSAECVGDEGCDIRESLFDLFSSKGIALLVIKPVDMSLEEIFMNVINGSLEEEEIAAEAAIKAEEKASENNEDISAGEDSAEGEDAADSEDSTEGEDAADSDDSAEGEDIADGEDSVADDDSADMNDKAKEDGEDDGNL